MNKPAPTAMRNRAQGGFTLIELIVVIVILGILAATALPKFSNLGSDARVASLNAVRGALSSTAASVHGQWLLNPVPSSVTFEGTPINYATTVASGYPKADTNFTTGSGITTTDYTIYPPGTTASATVPGTSATEIAVVPNSVANTAKALTCYVKYTEPTAVNTAPVISFNATSAGC